MSVDNCLRLLRDGEYHSGEELGESLGVSRTAVWKQLQKLEGLGLTLESVKGRGYRIPGGLDLLDRARIDALLGADVKGHISAIEMLTVVDSTNAEAARQIQQSRRDPGVYACLAEQQTAGRGRRGRSWVSPFARNLYISLANEFCGGAASLEGLSLAVAVETINALRDCGIEGATLKWPNDILFDGKKLAGILLEMSGDADGVCQLVAGVGLNVAMPAASAAQIDQPWIDLQSCAKEMVLDRSVLAAALLNRLVPLLAHYEQRGFAYYRAQWLALDAYADKPVNLIVGDHQISGIAKGVDATGALRLDCGGELRLFHGGEVSLRAL